MRNAIAITLVLLAAAPAWSQVQVQGAGLDQDLSCDGGEARVVGNGNTVRISGECSAIHIAGRGHEVSFEQADRLAVDGEGHEITGGTAGDLFFKGSGSKLTATLSPAGGDASTVEIAGAKQEADLTLEGAARIDVQGVDHEITWSRDGDAPEPRFSGDESRSRIEER